MEVRGAIPLLALVPPAAAEPQPLVPLLALGEVDQLGPTAADEDFILPHDFVITPRTTNFFEGNVVVGRARIDQPPPLPSPPPEFEYFEDRVHGAPFSPTFLIDDFPATFSEVEKTPPALARVFGDPDLVAGMHARDGSEAGKMTVELLQVPLDGGPVTSIEIEVDTTGPPFSALHSVDVVQDELDRMTGVYTEVTGSGPEVKAQRVDWDAVALIEELDIETPAVDPEIALLDPRGDRLVVVYNKLPASPGPGGQPLWTVEGSIIDTTGPAPVVQPGFAINTTAPTTRTRRRWRSARAACGRSPGRATTPAPRASIPSSRSSTATARRSAPRPASTPGSPPRPTARTTPPCASSTRPMARAGRSSPSPGATPATPTTTATAPIPTAAAPPRAACRSTGCPKPRRSSRTGSNRATRPPGRPRSRPIPEPRAMSAKSSIVPTTGRRLGAVAGDAEATSGSYFLDEFESFR